MFYSATFIDFNLTSASTRCSTYIWHVIKGFTYLLSYCFIIIWLSVWNGC